MKTFEDLYNKMKDEIPYSCPMHMKPYVKELAEIYATQVATQALKDAFTNAKIKQEWDHDGSISMHDGWFTDYSELEVDSDSILNTKIQLP